MIKFKYGLICIEVARAVNLTAPVDLVLKFISLRVPHTVQCPKI